MRTLLSILLCLGILVGTGALVGLLAKFKPEAQKVDRERLLPAVEVMIVQPANALPTLPSQGLLQAMRSTVLAAEVAGRVASVSPRFKVGERFAEGEILIELDGSDYRSAIVQAESALAEARAALAQEQARAEQAVRDWHKLAPGQPPTDLAARKPQMQSAEARVRAAEDTLERARRDLERTRLRAPFAGRLRATHTEVGSFLTAGARVADFESTGRYEIRLPLSLDDYAFLDTGSDRPVALSTTIGGNEFRWQGRFVRTEGEVERTSRSVHLVAEIAEDDEPRNAFLKPGLFLHAELAGRSLKGVFEIPRRALIDASRLLVIDPQDRLYVREVRVLRSGRDSVLIDDGLKAGERVCLTSLPSPVSGMQVRVIESPAAPAP
jgi:RND family efflux transporter MFP subunit